MRYQKLGIILIMVLFTSMTWHSAVVAKAEINCGEPDKVCRKMDTSLPLRALSKSFSNIYKSPNTANILHSNIKAFYPLYVFERKDIDYSEPDNPKGWYRVGASSSFPLGWMQAKDIMEWKQALVVSYTHPGIGNERRKPVLMYQNLDDLKKLVESDNRVEQAETAYKTLEKKPITIPKGVVSMEPKRFVDIETKEGFYILPVLDYEVLEDFFDEPVRYLQIAAAIPGERFDEVSGADLLENQAYAHQATQRETTQGTQAQNLGVDIKFVMDITGSMGPYIERTKEAIRYVATQVIPKIDTRVKFGLIGYRDDTRNFTPSLVDADGFVKVISTIRADGGGDYQGEMFAGVKQGIESDWSENSLRIMIIIGDASSHPSGHPLNLTGMGASELRALADANNVHVMAVHIKDKRAQKDHPIAQEQFRKLAHRVGSQTFESFYIGINADNLEAFEEVIKSLSETPAQIVAKVRATKGGDEIEVIETTTALVEYLGSAAKAPKDVTVWVLDRDLVNPAKKSLEVRLLINKSQLIDLITALEFLLVAVKRCDITGMPFLESLQAVMAASSMMGEKVIFRRAKNLKDSGLLPNWIASLPYKSNILEMDDELFELLGSDERYSLEENIEAKIELYRALNESELWFGLDDRDRSDDHVYPISLEWLP